MLSSLSAVKKYKDGRAYLESPRADVDLIGTELGRLVNTSSSLNSAFSGTSQSIIDFSVGNGSDIHLCDDMMVELQVANGDVAQALSLMPSFFLVDRIELLSQGSTIQTMYPLGMFQEFHAFADYTKSVQYQEFYNYSAVSGAATSVTIPAASSKRLYIPLKCFLTGRQTFLPALSTPIIVRLYMQTQVNACYSTSLSTTMSLESCYISMRGTKLGPDLYGDLMGLWRSGTFSIPIAGDQQRKNLNFGLLNAGVLSTQSVMNQKGVASAFITTLFDSNVSTPESQLTALSIDRLNFYDANGTVVNTATNQANTQFLCSIARMLPQRWATASGYMRYCYIMGFTNQLILSQVFPASVNGSRMFSGTESISFAPTANIVNANLVLFFFLLKRAYVFADGSVNIGNF